MTLRYDIDNKKILKGLGEISDAFDGVVESVEKTGDSGKALKRLQDRVNDLTSDRSVARLKEITKLMSGMSEMQDLQKKASGAKGILARQKLDPATRAKWEAEVRAMQHRFTALINAFDASLSKVQAHFKSKIDQQAAKLEASKAAQQAFDKGKVSVVVNGESLKNLQTQTAANDNSPASLRRQVSAAVNMAVAEGRVFQRVNSATGAAGNLVNATKRTFPGILGSWMSDLNYAPTATQSKTEIAGIEAQTLAWTRLMEKQLLLLKIREHLASQSGRLVGSFTSEDALARTKQLYELEARLASNRDILATQSARLVGSFTSEDALARTKQLYELEARLASNRDILATQSARLVGSFTSEDALARTKQLYELEARLASNRDILATQSARLVGSFTSEDALARTKQLYELEARLASNRDILATQSARLVGSFTSEDALARTKQLYELEARLASNRDILATQSARLVGSFTSEDALARTKQLYELEARLASNRDILATQSARLVGSFTSEDALARTKQLYELEARLASNRDILATQSARLVGSFTSEDALARTKQLYALEEKIRKNREALATQSARLAGSFTSEDALARTKQLYELESRLAANRETLATQSARLVGSFASEDALAKTKQLYAVEERIRRNRELMRQESDRETLRGAADSSDVLRSMREHYLNAGAISRYSSSSFDQPETGRVPTPRELNPEPVKEFDDAFKGLNRTLWDTHSAARGLASGFGLLWLTWGSMIPLLTGAAISFGVAATLKQGKDLSIILADIQFLAGTSADQMRELEATLVDTANAAAGPREVAEALRRLTLAGMSATEAGKALGVVLNLANVSNMDVGKAAESLTAIGTAFGYTAQGFEKVADTISAVAAASMADIEDMTEAFRVASTVAQTYGVRIDDAAVSLGLLAQVGIKGSAAGTAFRQMVVELAGVSEQAKKTMKNVFKLNIFDDARGQIRPMMEIVGSMAETLKGLKLSEQIDMLQKVGNERGLKALSAWLEAYAIQADKAEKATGGLVTQASKLQELSDAARDSAGLTAFVAAMKNNTFGRQWEAVGADIQRSMQVAFEASESYAVAFMSSVRKLFSSEELRSSLTSLLDITLRFGKVLVDNAAVLATLAKLLVFAGTAYLTYKAVTLSASLATTLLGRAVAVTSVQAAAASANFSLMRTTLRGTTAALGGASVATSVFGVSATVTARALTLLNLAAGKIGIVLSVAAAAWALFADKKEDAMSRLADDAKQFNDMTLQGLDQEILRLEKTLELQKDKSDASLKGLKIQQAVARAEMQMKQEAERAPIAAEAAAAQAYWDANFGEGSPKRAVRDLQAELVARDRLRVANEQLKTLETAQNQTLSDFDVRSRRVQLLAQQVEKANPPGRAPHVPDLNAPGLEDFATGGGMGGGFGRNAVGVNQDLDAARRAELEQIRDHWETQKKVAENYRKAEIYDESQYQDRLAEIRDASYEEQSRKVASNTRAAAEEVHASREKALRDIDNNLRDQKQRMFSSKGKGADFSELEKSAAQARIEVYKSSQAKLLEIAAQSEADQGKLDNERAEDALNRRTKLREETLRIEREAAKDILKIQNDLADALEEINSRRAESQQSRNLDRQMRYMPEAEAARAKAQFDEGVRVRKELDKYDRQIREAASEADRLMGEMEKATNADVVNNLDAQISALEARRLALIEGRAQVEESLGKEAAQNVAAAYEDAMLKAVYEISKTLEDGIISAIRSAGKGGSDILRDSLQEALISKPLEVEIRAFVKPITDAVGSARSWVGKQVSSLFSGQLGTTAAMYGTNFGSEQTAMLMAQEGGGLAGLGTSAANLLGGAAVAASAFGTGMAASFSSMMAAGVSGWATAAGSLIGSSSLAGIAAGVGMIAAPIAAAALLWKPLFGRKLKDAGIQGTFSNETFLGTSFEFYKGGLFRSNKTKTSELDSGIAAGIGQDLTKRKKNMQTLAESLGLDASPLGGFTFDLKVSTKGKTGEEVQKALEEEYARAAEEMAGLLLKEPEKYVRLGESVSGAMARMSAELATVNAAFLSFGWTLKKVSLDGATAAGDLLAQFESIDEFRSLSSSYFQNYYSEQERQEAMTRSMTAEFKKLGLALPGSRDEFRALVEAAQAAGDNERLAALLKLNAGFAEMTQAAQAAAEALGITTSRFATLAEYEFARDMAGTVIGRAMAGRSARALPAFATGGYHTGGLRIVGENGPELEATGPSRIYNAAQTEAMLSGNGADMAEVVAELRYLRAEVARLTAAQAATAIHSAKTAKVMTRVQDEGMPVINARTGETLTVATN